MRVTVMIPTQRRLDGLAVAARSVLAQLGVDFTVLELVVVDNDQVPSARATVADLADQAPFPVHYVHEPRPGVAHARNAGMARASGELIAFLDDDEEAPAGWLAALLAAQARYEADVVFGPVRARAPASVTRHRDYLERFFSREGPAQAGIIDHYYGCGDSLLRRAALPDPVAPFAVERNHIGGEDDMLFGHMRAGGARFAWEPAAWVWEDPVPDRLSLDYTIRRAFAYGQGPSAHCAAASPPDRLGVARWMAVGVVQSALFGLVAGFKWLTRAGDRADWLDRAARGLGKTLWWGPFKIHFYGRTAS
ncbi:glycosyltransferase family 2 protein [Caulobacter sp. UNC279MFTsu5.1]|uniref:glycosyltransferase family 2 protein n=1 Tax=Caulobacter sp. UNC279MFTsu5.1 TaxID=1502775 RepID=UPI0008E6FF66|nr:glycosyltransferase family 2 protein [Caulobacter sp. UNC279MFTsu5.1]SFJ03683.1 Glycosyl transferase family 2 [Caulobacter sp. UNC279MFTsu5.1]